MPQKLGGNKRWVVDELCQNLRTLIGFFNIYEQKRNYATKFKTLVKVYYSKISKIISFTILVGLAAAESGE